MPAMVWKNDRGWDGYKIIKNSPLLAGTKLKTGDILYCPSDETDGVPLVSFENGIPMIDYRNMISKLFNNDTVFSDEVDMANLAN